MRGESGRRFAAHREASFPFARLLLHSFDELAEFFGVSLQESPDFLRRLLLRLDTLPVNPSELVVHPGYTSPELAQLDAYTTVRERELTALLGPERPAARRQNI